MNVELKTVKADTFRTYMAEISLWVKINAYHQLVGCTDEKKVQEITLSAMDCCTKEPGFHGILAFDSKEVCGASCGYLLAAQELELLGSDKASFAIAKGLEQNSKRFAWSAELIVKPSHQKKGLGTKLEQALLTAFRKTTTEKILCLSQTSELNKASVRIHQKIYTPTGITYSDSFSVWWKVIE